MRLPLALEIALLGGYALLTAEQAVVAEVCSGDATRRLGNEFRTLAI